MITEGYIFLFLIETICCDHSFGPSHREKKKGYNIGFCAELTIPNYH